MLAFTSPPRIAIGAFVLAVAGSGAAQSPSQSPPAAGSSVASSTGRTTAAPTPTETPRTAPSRRDAAKNSGVRTARPAPSRAVLAARLADKLASPFLKRFDWHTDFATAQRAAARLGMPIFCHFTRSFVPCGTSIRCEHEVLDQEAFGQIAERAVLYCHVTAHLDADGDAALFRAHGHGWPHHVVVDASGRRLARHSGDKTVESFARLLDSAEQVQAAHQRYRSAVAAATLAYLEPALAADALSLDEAHRLFAALPPLPVTRRQNLTAQLVDLEVRGIASRYDRFDPDQQRAAGAELYSLCRQRKRPTDRDASRDFWGGILLWLEAQPTTPSSTSRMAIYDEGLGALERLFGESRGYRRFLDERRAWRNGTSAGTANQPGPRPTPPAASPSSSRSGGEAHPASDAAPPTPVTTPPVGSAVGRPQLHSSSR